MREIKVSDHQRWQGTYKGISFQVCKWRPDYVAERPDLDRGYNWNYYIFVKPRKLKTYQLIDKKTKRVDYYKMYSDVEMHGGITYWSRHKTSTLQEVDEIGCDYGHSWDEGIEYDLDSVLSDVKSTIDNLPSDLLFNNVNAQ